MGRRRWECNGYENRYGRRLHRHCGGGIFSIFGLIFAIAGFAMTIAFKVIELVFQVFFGVLGRGGADAAAKGTEPPETPGKGDAPGHPFQSRKPDLKYEEAAMGSIKEDLAGEKAKPESNAGSANMDSKNADGNNKEEVKNKDWLVVIFLLTVLPCIVALAMGQLFYAGVIGLSGLGLLILTCIIVKAAGSWKNKPEAAEAHREEEEQQESPVENLIKEAFDKICEIRKDLVRVPDAEIRARIEAICCTGEKIIGEVRTNPDNLKLVRKFFYYYLDAFSDIVRKYLRLSGFSDSSEEVLKLLQETEKSFQDIESIFKELCEKLLEQDMMNLKAEINVMRSSG